MSLMKVRDLKVVYESRHERIQAVRHLDFEIKPGEIVGLVGESGSGKSTGVRAIMGLLPESAAVSADRIEFDGEDISDVRKLRNIRGSKLAMVFQEPASYLNPTVKIGRQLTETLRTHLKCRKDEVREQALELLDMVGIRCVEECMNRYPFELSGGMCQRVVIAIALAGNPKMIIADEPTASLDVTVQGQILELFRRIAAELGVAVLLVTHDLGIVSAFCSRVMVMSKGEIVEQGDRVELFRHPKHDYTRALLAYRTKRMEPVKREIREEKLLRVCNIQKQYQGLEAVNGVSFQILKGESFGLVGESGCGKTTLARMVTGVMKNDGGEIYYKENPIKEKGFWDKYRSEIQMIFQNPSGSLNPRLKVAETLEEPLLIHKLGSREERRIKAAQMLELVGLNSRDGNKYPHEFSGGQRQRIGIARALILEPELVVCDEPVSALDATVRYQILELLQRTQKKTGLSYLMISHDLSVVRNVTERVGIMYLGTMVEIGKTRSVFKEPWHPYTKLLLAAGLDTGLRHAKRSGSIFLQESGRGKIPEKSECPFADRCGYVMECCKKERPERYKFGDREIACFLYSEKHTKKRRQGYRMTVQI